MKHIIKITLIIILSSTGMALHAETFSGTYTLSADNVKLTLNLQQNGNRITGKLTGTTGAEFTLDGNVMESFCEGRCFNNESQVFFNLYIEGEELYMQLIEPGSDGNPDYSRLRELIFRKGGSQANLPQQSAPGTVQDGHNPLAGNNLSDLSGTYKGDGLELILKRNGNNLTGKLVFSENTYTVSAEQNRNQRLSGTFKAPEGSFSFNAIVQGEKMSFETGGTLFTLEKVLSSKPANPLLKNKTTQNPLQKQPQLSETVPSSGNSKRISEKAYGYSFVPPDGWIAKKDEQSGNYVMGSNTVRGMIILFPHSHPSLQEMVNASGQGIIDEGVQLYPCSEVEILSQNSAGAEFSGFFQNVQAKGYVAGVVSPTGSGLTALCLTEDAKYSDSHKKASISLSKSIQFFKPVVDKALVAWISGGYYSYVGSTERKLTLCPNGTFYTFRETSYSGTLSNQYGDQTGAWGVGGQDDSDGRWSIIGNKQQGTIHLTYKNGETGEMNYKVLGRGGFLFNGIKYGYAGPPKCR